MARRGLERSCRGWVRCGVARGGIQPMRAWFAGAAFARHRHDTYALGVTDSGVQSFWYRGTVHASTPGDAVVLHPDEAHDGYAGSGEGFGYRIVYVEPARVAEALRVAAGRPCALPFLRRPVVRSVRLSRSIAGAFAAAEGLAADAAILELAEALAEAAEARHLAPPRLDAAAVERARQLLDSAANRVVHSAELEAASGLSRFELARQFRQRFGTSPYRYSVMRRLEAGRRDLATRAVADVALDAGFSDQAHFTRAFKSAYGLTPARYRELTA